MKIIKTTLIGGIVFLVPFVILLALLKRGGEIVQVVVVPIKNLFPDNDFLGINVLTIAVLFGVCFLAGLLARRSVFAERATQLNKTLSQKVPGYSMVKGVIGGHLGTEVTEEDTKPVLIRDLTGGIKIGLEIERDPSGFAVIYFPSAPNPQSGFVQIYPVSMVDSLDIKPFEAVEMMQFYGLGMAKFAGAKSTKA